MDDATVERACRELVAAAAERERGDASAVVRERIARAADHLAPSLEGQVRAVAVRNAKLFRDARLDVEDAAQEVLRRLMESPPRNPEGRDPVAAVFGWARAVASNVALDRRRRTIREAREDREAGAGSGERDATEPVDAERGPEDVLAVLGDIERMHAAAKELASYKYLRETFEVLVRDPDVTALELARSVGLIDAKDTGGDYAVRAKRAAQYAWKLRQRMLDVLAVRMGES